MDRSDSDQLAPYVLPDPREVEDALRAQAAQAAQQLADPLRRQVILPPIRVGEANPLTAAYCAERAARALQEAEQYVDHMTPRCQNLIEVARRWQKLAVAIGSYTTLSRPKEPSPQERPR